MKAPPQAKASSPQPAFQTKHNVCQATCLTTDDTFFDTAKLAPFFSSTNTTLDGCNPSPATCMVFRNSFDALSFALKDKENNVKALMTFSLSPNTTAPSHVSTKPQHSKNKHQNSKMFYSKPKSHATLTKKHSPNIGMRSASSFKKTQLSPMANANGMVFNSYLKPIMTEITNLHQTPTTL